MSDPPKVNSWLNYPATVMFRGDFDFWGGRRFAWVMLMLRFCAGSPAAAATRRRETFAET